MRKVQVTSVSLPPELEQEAQKLQQKSGMTRSELYRAALRRYIRNEQRWEQAQTYGAKQAKKLGLKTDQDVLAYAVKSVRAYRKKQA